MVKPQESFVKLGLSENIKMIIVDSLSFSPLKEPYAEENPCKSPMFRHANAVFHILLVIHVPPIIPTHSNFQL